MNRAAREKFDAYILPIGVLCPFHLRGRAPPGRAPGSSPVLCGSISNDGKLLHLHIDRNHTRIIHERLHARGEIPADQWHCFHRECVVIGLPGVVRTTKSIFASERELNHHLYAEHRVTTAPFKPVVWCGFCKRFLDSDQSRISKDNHFAFHWEEVWAKVRNHGY
jgi:hypothetical protein